MAFAFAEAFGPGCPWWEQRQTWGPPNVKWCEETVCAWVNEPANAWSNLGYIAVAILLLFQGFRTRSRARLLFGTTIFLVGATSFAYHATNNYATQILDFLGMFLFVFLLVALNLRRLGLIRQTQEVAVHVGLVVLGLALIPALRAVHVPFQLLILGSTLFIIGAELRLRGRIAIRPSYRPFAYAFGALALAAACSASDVTRAWCEPGNHFVQGHALWHLLSAVALHFAAQFYAQPGVLEEAPAGLDVAGA